MIILYMEIFTGQKFRQAQLKFHQCGKGRHVLYAVINEGQKNKISPMKANDEIFLVVKISTYTHNL